MCQAMLTPVMYTSYLSQTNVNWLQPALVNPKIRHKIWLKLDLLQCLCAKRPLMLYSVFLSYYVGYNN